MKKISRLFFSFALFISLVFCGHAYCQKKDTLRTVPDTVKKHSPVTATIMSAVIPGLGQSYNKKYWKVPVIYGGLLTAGYFVKINRGYYLEFKNAYIAEIDSDQTTINTTNLPLAGLQSYMEFYRTRMEISYIALGLLYVLNVVDATVDAHLFTFDISDDLSIRVMPEFNTFSHNSSYTGMKLILRL